MNKNILIRLPLGRVKQIDKLVSEGFVANRNEAIREAVRDYCEVMPK